MFSEGHLIWIGISAALIAAGLFYCLKFKPPLKKVLTVCFVIGLISEVVKVLSTIEIVPMVDPIIAEQNGAAALQWIPSGEYTPYLAMEHMPLELCSLYLVFMLLALVLKDGKVKNWLFALMFASGTMGGLLGIIGSSIAGDFETTAEFFAAPRAWQFFIFHSMIVVLGIYIAVCSESVLKPSDWKKALLGMLLLDIPTFYLNSVFSSEVYSGGKVVGVTHRINFFSSYVNPLGIVLTEKWQWIVYIIARAAMVVLTVWILYLIFVRKKKEASPDEK